MFHKRWIGLVVVALILFGIFSAIGAAGQREAWMQGYLAGSLSTGADGGAALAPYMMSRGWGFNSGGFGHPFGVFFGLGILCLGLFFISRRLHHWRGRAGGPDEWHEHMRREAERWHERRQRRWEEWRRDDPRQNDESQRMV